MVSGAPAVVTTQSANSYSEQAILQAMVAGMNPQQQQAVAAQLAQRARVLANKYYVTQCIEKLDTCLTNGQPTQPYVQGQDLTFNLTPINNAFCKGIRVKYTVNYTLAAGTGATYAPTFVGELGLIRYINVRYNRSQILLRPIHLRELALAGALDYPSSPDISRGVQNDGTVENYVNSSFVTTAGAQTYSGEIFVPFNLLKRDETRGLLPQMPGETGIQVIVTTPTSILGPDPLDNCIYNTGGTGNAISAVSGTVAVESVYLDGDVYNSPTKASYDMNVLQGTIQMQIDNVLQNIVAGSIQVGKLNIVGLHQYVLLMIVDGQQSTVPCFTQNIQYLHSAQDAPGSNLFWKYGGSSPNNILEFFVQQRHIHNGDLDPGCIFMIQAPLIGQSAPGARDGKQWLDNSKNGWPAWHYGFQLGAISTANGITPRVEPFTVFVNPVGLQPISVG